MMMVFLKDSLARCDLMDCTSRPSPPVSRYRAIPRAPALGAPSDSKNRTVRQVDVDVDVELVSPCPRGFGNGARPISPLPLTVPTAVLVVPKSSPAKGERPVRTGALLPRTGRNGYRVARHRLAKGISRSQPTRPRRMRMYSAGLPTDCRSSVRPGVRPICSGSFVSSRAACARSTWARRAIPRPARCAPACPLTRNIQDGPRFTGYRRQLHISSAAQEGRSQHKWSGPPDGQHFHRTSVAVGEMGGGLPQRP